MAATHIGCNEATVYGRMLKNNMTNFELGYNGINNLLASMSLMINGDGTLDSHYTDMTAKFGFASDAISHAAFNEVNALSLKITSDASQTLIKTAILQAINKFR